MRIHKDPGMTSMLFSLCIEIKKVKYNLRFWASCI